MVLPLSLGLYLLYTLVIRKEEEGQDDSDDLLSNFKRSTLQKRHQGIMHMIKDDSWIIGHLPYAIEERGADGNCLFYSMMFQIEKEDFSLLADSWRSDPVVQQWSSQAAIGSSGRESKLTSYVSYPWHLKID